MIAAGCPRQAAFVAAEARACNDQMFGGFPGTWSGGRTPSRPAVVPLARRDGTDLDAVAQLVGRVQKRLNLVKAGEREVPVVRARERPKQPDALQAEEIRQRVLVDHGSFHEPFRMPT
jgi:hypothetical protein